MKLSRRAWMLVSGGSWFGIGMLLLLKGLRFLTSAMDAGPIVNLLTSFAGSKQQASLLLISIALLVGFIKGRVVLAKTVKRIVERILSSQNLVLNEVYDRKYYIILGVMMGIGLLFRFLPIPHDIRGFIDVAIGSALMNGGMLYFRESLSLNKQSSNLK